MNRERLERLALLLEGYRDGGTQHFSLRNWGTSGTRQGGFLWLRQHTCGTAACAVGLACDSGVFSEEGLACSLDENGGLTPLFGELEGWSAVKKFFDVDQDQAVKLFAEHSYRVTEGEPAARAVAVRIREMITLRDVSVR